MFQVLALQELGSYSCLECLSFALTNGGLMLETSAYETLYSGQFTLSTQFIKTWLFNVLSYTLHLILRSVDKDFLYH